MLAVVHCVEGAFHLGPDPAGIDTAVAGLKRRGVAYLTLGHLWFKAVAHVAPSWATIGEERWEQLWPQPPRSGLAPLGRAAVEACVNHRLPLDVTHLSERSLADMWELLDALDPERALPVLASHTAVRRDGREYALTADTIRRIAERDGIVGLISSDHQLQPDRPPRHLAETAGLLAEHVRAIEHITGTTGYAALGTDLGGGLEDAPECSDLATTVGRPASQRKTQTPVFFDCDARSTPMVTVAMRLDHTSGRPLQPGTRVKSFRGIVSGQPRRRICT